MTNITSLNQYRKFKQKVISSLIKYINPHKMAVSCLKE
ncbi:hypothetical protein FHU10_1377 [Serratia fonticola]|uniref:Uncharacterized protein n=1 Tax=Serratia fonticola TaxID=47917 RepID=A0A542D8I4_SERFO|nr:hypothetical protein FHU09_1073 [Serratia fonticola]TQI99390.1 hypothetical protein FHU11_4978 [Serratia fonticola]TVZ68915.1 hypothetical protein FHU10_1377 [Serratia fonticola]